jgi:lipid II:glycine glycyltransferase (peptidoglycan interpeptide bridge formation enzyme)
LNDKTIDPSENVKALNEAANQRQDDLRAASEKLFDTKIEAVNQRIDDSIERFDSFRKSDREELVKTAALVVTTAETLRAQSTDINTEFNKRLSAVELSLSATGAGSAGEKAGRVSQQDIIKYVIYLILAAIAIAAYLKKG